MTRRERSAGTLGPIPVESLHEAIAASEQKPVQIYSMATLEVLPRAMPEFTKLIGEGAIVTDSVVWETFVTHNEITNFGDDREPQDQQAATTRSHCCG